MFAISRQYGKQPTLCLFTIRSIISNVMKCLALSMRWSLDLRLYVKCTIMIGQTYFLHLNLKYIEKIVVQQIFQVVSSKAHWSSARPYFVHFCASGIKRIFKLNGIINCWSRAMRCTAYLSSFKLNWIYLNDCNGKNKSTITSTR